MASISAVTWRCKRCNATMRAWIVLESALFCRCGEQMTAPRGELRRQRLYATKLLATHGRGWKRLRFGYGARLRRQRRR